MSLAAHGSHQVHGARQGCSAIAGSFPPTPQHVSNTGSPPVVCRGRFRFMSVYGLVAACFSPCQSSYTTWTGLVKSLSFLEAAGPNPPKPDAPARESPSLASASGLGAVAGRPFCPGTLKDASTRAPQRTASPFTPQLPQGLLTRSDNLEKSGKGLAHRLDGPAAQEWLVQQAVTLRAPSTYFRAEERCRVCLLGVPDEKFCSRLGCARACSVHFA